jgi:hypothetical protein
MKFLAHKRGRKVVLIGHSSLQEAQEYFELCYSLEMRALAWDWKISEIKEPEKTESKLANPVTAFLSKVGAEGGSKSKRKKSPQNQT